MSFVMELADPMANEAMLDEVQAYEAPSLIAAAGPATEEKEWIILGIALALAIIWYGGAWGFCWADCHGRVASCSTGGPFWGRYVTAVCFR